MFSGYERNEGATERFKNELLFGFLGTNKEREELMGSPGAGALLIALFIVAVLIYVFK